MAYFDYNATTPLNPSGRQEMLDALDGFWANPSSPYKDSALVHNALESAREKLSFRLKKSEEEVVFTGGATEANNGVIEYLAGLLPVAKKLAISPFEHPSVAAAASHYFQDRIHVLKATPAGIIDMVYLYELLKSGDLGAISLMAVNNETGVIQPWEAVGQLCRENGLLFHCDASQWFGKCPAGDFVNCDFVVGCGHKFGGPKGVGFLGLSSNSHGFCSQLGGSQESGRRGGTENVPSILAMGAALEFADEHSSDMDRQSIYRDEFETVLESILPELECIGKSATRVPNTSFLIMPRFENIRWVRKLDIKGFQVSTGSACSTGDTASSPILNALGYPEDLGRRTIRISAGPSTSRSDWERLAEAFREVWSDLQQSDSSRESEVISI